MTKEYLSDDTVPQFMHIEKLAPPPLSTSATTVKATIAPPPCPAADTKKPSNNISEQHEMEIYRYEQTAMRMNQL